MSVAGFITKEEAETYETTQCRYLKFWVPLMWANNIIARARREGRIETEFGLRMVLEVHCDVQQRPPDTSHIGNLDRVFPLKLH